MNKTVKKILYPVLALLILCIAAAAVLNTDMFRQWRLGKQLTEKYGTGFTLKDPEEDIDILPASHCYMATSDEGIRSYVNCDWKGKQISDSYAHYYYSDEMAGALESLLGPAFDKCYAVRDCLEFGSSSTLIEFVSTSDSASLEDYLASDREVTVTYRVYVDQYVTAGQLRNALDILSGQAADYSVYFLRVQDPDYEMIRDAGLKCYYPFSDVSAVYSAYARSWGGRDVYGLINKPFDYAVAEFVPKYDKAEICEDFYERSREYFEDLDEDRTLDDICSEIGYFNGIKGSGIWKYIWTLNDGTDAMVVFDSLGKIETVRIYDPEQNDSEIIYDRYPD